MEFKKNDLVQVTIEDMSHEGAGIGKADGYTLFIKDAVIGDKVEAKIMKTKKHYGFARLMKVLEPSKDRVEAKCPQARACGGCQLQFMNYEAQLAFKKNKVEANLRRIGGFDNFTIEKVIGMEDPWRYRNKAQFPVGRDKNGNIVIGFYAGRTHSIIDSDTCAIGAEVNDQILPIIRAFLTEYNISTYNETTGQGLVRHILTRVGFTTGEVMVCLIVNGKKLPHADELISRLTKISGMTSICLNINTEKTNKILGPTCKTLWGSPYITDYIGNVKYRISPLSFYQVNPVQTKVLYEKALEYADLNGEETVWDMYCGIGTISLFLAQKAKQVYGVEIVPQAILDARKNAELNDIHNVEFFTGKAEEVVPAIYEKGGDGSQADVVVVDPPRKGCDKVLLDTLIRMNPKRLVYVSCDPATLARDIAILTPAGYHLEKVAVVDQFGHTGHCENVCLLSKKL